ncbi:phosphatase PAP2 family protein [Polyangium aurulentum]|uniref:phosphatase PAP2 family protein n=1 Tax=Polyangium aurulentum TaxID=2567896 RepID=UPI00146EE73A|nr:phosphatase PAP2 family protein [Polyangium aurulentum]UQA62087.1 phosphatase PAP2 family protein [Polyangium aurulentum]
MKVSILLLALLAPASALADPPPPPAAPPVKSSPAAKAPARPMLTYDLPADLTWVGVGGAAWLTLEMTKRHIAPSTCRWCNPPGVDASVKSGLRWSNIKLADTLSNVTGFALVPLAAYGLDAAVVLTSGGTVKEWGIDALVITEAIVAASDLNQFVKFAVGRERPFVFDIDADGKGKTSAPGDNNLSFYSGHAALGFSAAVSAGTIATLKGYKAAPWIWATGLTIAATTGYLRIAADKHYFTDVLLGAVTGSAIGFAVPYLHRPCVEGRACVTGMSAAPAFGGGGTVGLRGILP